MLTFFENYIQAIHFDFVNIGLFNMNLSIMKKPYRILN